MLLIFQIFYFCNIYLLFHDNYAITQLTLHYYFRLHVYCIFILITHTNFIHQTLAWKY
jgi:hypothetical protein